MHPADVAQHVADSVDVLRDRLRETPGLATADPVLEGATDLYVAFDKLDRELVSQAVGTSLVLPGGQPISMIYQVPLLGAPRLRSLLLHMQLDDFDGRPPTAELLLPDRTPLPPDQWPKSIGGQGIVPNHRDFGRPFFCRRGLREYHTHPEHEDDPWEAHREHLRLDALVLELLDGLRNKWIGR
ncbi:hypothetical protein E4P41_13875 [Geodermatophilus sp. DF01-2]|uniref:hypothetical protein n=1 Tax=Geodermatophilus sp. DF01-2 TaxID=2559610 RepID=UPI001073B22B|nr:hypothetical protein [Geodermatophilus sp. DF01_2]TFV57743.1 hypothetical protein E4P41_13875 [Geodermatophilus sp. DF01_2]